MQPSPLQPNETNPTRPLTLTEALGLITLLFFIAYFAFIILSKADVVKIVYFVLLVVWLLMDLTVLRFGPLALHHLRASVPVELDIPWFVNKRPLINADHLSRPQRIVFTLLAAVNPPAVAIILIGIWWKRSYLKARQANIIALGMLIAWAAYFLVSSLG